MQNKSVCIIPARGGSKRIPRKNIKSFFRESFIAYFMLVVTKSNLDKFIVSTNDEKLVKIVKDYGVNVSFFSSNASSNFSEIKVLTNNNLEYLKKQSKIYNFFYLFIQIYLLKNKIMFVKKYWKS